LRFQWGNSAITSWDEWQADGYDANGFNQDPVVAGVLGHGPWAYYPAPGSPARDHGRAVTDALRGMGTQDAFGAWIPQGAAYDIGAAEYRLISPDPAAARLTAFYRLGGGWQLQFSGLSGRSYRVETSSDLKSWRPAGTAEEGLPGSFEFTDRSDTALRVYRVIARGVPGG
jgi:hypothetical protein